jgi:hypothetical protein
MSSTRIIIKPDSPTGKLVKDIMTNMEDFRKKVQEGKIVKPKNEKPAPAV